MVKCINQYFFATCQSIGVVYYMECQCGMFYIGKTKRPFSHRIRNRVGLVNAKKFESPISCHMGLCHQFDCTKKNFFALEYIPINERGGDVDKLLLQRETKWIFNLSATKHSGLNDSLSFKPFL